MTLAEVLTAATKVRPHKVLPPKMRNRLTMDLPERASRAMNAAVGMHPLAEL